ncbi:TetR/AcrR family transcriptional regulator [Methylocapsa palsarum]|uniref:TetR/AcrR family transcriptional regulator, transcriptional repressor for nem operon n=1 Tax=Methylocapsa palsarum TaxID=1612308 RepID=A0A1I4ADQ8_9HYPH|nr:TetR/AcrR family transcriptional regulator [Methylocapsa palsarum]SFK54575.1 TetR/AcrR family transcriptional regulator, transcriptional repressor for nem operon [Methylocapsa palsarum]
MTRDQTEINKSLILDHGVSLFMRKGYHGTGLSEVLAAARVPKGSFYYYFASKEEFGVEVVRHYIQPFIDELTRYLGQDGIGAMEALEDYFRGLALDLDSKGFEGGCLLGNLMGEIGDTSDMARAALRSAVDRYRDLLETALLRAQREGSARKDKSARAMADLLIDAWQGALLRMKLERSGGPLKAFLEEVLLGYCKA